MRIAIALLVFSILCTRCVKDEEPSDKWVKKPQISDSYRNDPIGFAIGSKAFVGLGWEENFNRDWWSFDPKKNKWTRLNDFPERTIINGVFVAGKTKGYVGLGLYSEKLSDGSYKSETSRDIWEYNPINDKWTLLTQYPGEALYNITAFMTDDKLYIATGYKAGQSEPGTNTSECSYLEKELWEYNIEKNSWNRKKNVSTPMSGGCYEPTNLASGISTDFEGFLLFELRHTTQNQLWRYHIETDSWSLDPIFLVSWGKNDNLSFVINRNIYFGTASSYLWKKYNIDTKIDDDNSWIENYPGTQGNNGLAFAIDNRGYVFLNNGEFWEYLP